MLTKAAETGSRLHIYLLGAHFIVNPACCVHEVTACWACFRELAAMLTVLANTLAIWENNSKKKALSKQFKLVCE